MHRTIEITTPPEATERLLRELQAIEHVVGLSLQRGASLKPPGDVVTVHALNRGSDAVLRAAAAARARSRGAVSVATSETASLSDPEHQRSIDRDIDEAVWEELEAGLRHQGRVTPNFLMLMALGGAIAAVAMFMDPVYQTLAFVAAAIIAPGFEPVAKIPLGLVLRRLEVVKAGLAGMLAGYAALVAGAAAAFLLLLAAGAATREAFLQGSTLHSVAHPDAKHLLLSACAALAGIVIQAAYRHSVIAGPLVGLRLIEAAAVIGVAAALGEWGSAREGAERLAIDVALIFGAGLLVLGAKQLLVHRRAPLH